MRTTTSLLLSLALFAGTAGPLAASPVSVDPQGRGQAKAAQGQKQKPKAKPAKTQKPGKGTDKQTPTDRTNRVIDRDGHVRVIREHESRGLPPGLAKREALPPGLRKQLRERGTLPPGLQQRLVGVPAEWTQGLPAIGRYERRYFAGNDLLIVDTRTNTILAIIADVLR